MAAIAIKEIQSNETLWMKYYHDFVYHVLHFRASSDSFEYKLLQMIFFNQLQSFSTMKVIAAHCYVHMYQVDLARTVGLLRPLGTLLEKTRYSGLSHDQLQTPQFSKYPQEIVSHYAVEVLFGLMVKFVDQDTASTSKDWYCLFKYMVS